MVGLTVTAVVLAFGLLLMGYDVGSNPWTIAALILVGAVAERSGIWITRTTQMSIALLPTLFAAVLFGPLAAGLVNAMSMLGDPELFARSDPDRAPRLKWTNYTSSRFITGAAAGLVAQNVIGRTTSHFGGLLIATLVAALTAEALDILAAGREIVLGAV